MAFRIQVEIDKQLPIETYDTNVIGIRWLQVLVRYKNKILADYLKTTATWDNKPEFKSEIRYRGADPTVIVGTDSIIYQDLDEGTDVRFDVMTHDPLFEPKTSVGFIGSVEGVGGYAYTTTSDDPREGIEARLFSVVITDRYRDEFFREIQKATDAGLAARKKI
jgi:hypothetical protein